MNRIDLDGRVAVITGGASGIGFAAAQRMAASGAVVHLWDVNPQALAGACARQTGTRAHRVDITDEDQVARAVRDVVAASGRVDILVNSAGIGGERHAVVELPLAEWRRVIDVNLTGTFLCCKAIVPAMQVNDYGRIVNLSSTAGKDGNALVAAYSAAKAAVMSLTKSLGKELAQTGIRVNCLTPAMIATEFADTMDPERIRTALARIPMGRAGRPEEVAAMIAWLSSEECSYSTGAAFDLSGGRSTY
jgi:NAD(P)-dependent dehydrogenase (short-subunit alcohol dehydrogenase family)